MQIDVALLELGAIMLALAVGGRLAVRAGLPTIPVFLLAGLFFGTGGVVPIEEADQFIEIGSSLGVIFLLFLLGLEYTPGELRQSLRSNGRAGVVDLVLNATPGFVAGLILGWGALGAMALAGITYISSSGIIAKLLVDLGRLGNRETPGILSVLVIEDLVMAVSLPVIAVLLDGGSAVGGLVSGVVSLGIVVAVLTVAPRAERHANRFINTESPELLLITLLGVALVVAGFAESMHISYAIGAFLLGIVLSGQVAERAREMLEPLRNSFAALFFVYFGLEVDIATFGPVLVPALGLATVGAATKIATGYWAARQSGVSPRGARRAGVALVPRGEFSIVLAGIAVAGEVNRDLKSFVVVYVLMLAVGGSVAARYVR
ncbi:MAG: cation:proton antiporter [Ilumatobacteraceae bacterium]